MKLLLVFSISIGLFLGFVNQSEALECYSCLDYPPNDYNCANLTIKETINCDDTYSCYVFYFQLTWDNATFRTCNVRGIGMELGKTYPISGKKSFNFEECWEDACNYATRATPIYSMFIIIMYPIYLLIK